MARIPEKDRDMLEHAIYLPMLLKVLQRDLFIIEQSPFKLKKPYMNMIESTIHAVQKDLSGVKRYLRKNSMGVEQLKSDDIFTMYAFRYKGYEEHHNYFNPRLRNRVEELLDIYLKSENAGERRTGDGAPEPPFPFNR